MASDRYRKDTPVPGELEQRGRTWLEENKGSQSPQTHELLFAARKGRTNDIERILSTEKGGSDAATITDRHGRNCLHLACHYGNLDSVLLILKMQVVDINSVTKKGFTPLHEASGEGRLDVVYVLLAFGAFLKARSKDGWTPLMSACYTGHYNVAKILIAAGQDVNATNKHGYTALHVAAWRGNTSIIELLLKENALITAESVSGKTPLHIAQEEKQHEAITVLQAASVRESEQPFYRIAALEGQLRVFQERLAQINAQHEERVSEMQMKSSEQFSEMKRMYAFELREAKLKIEKLEEQVKKFEKKRTKNPNQVVTEESEPSVKIAVNNKTPTSLEKHQKDIRPQQDTTIASINVSPMTARKLSHRKSAEEETMDILGIDPLKTAVPVTSKPRRSFEGQRTTFVTPKPTGNRLTITQLVEENMHVPGTMAAIKRELKADGLTPRINRKLQQQQQLQQQTMSLYSEHNGSSPSSTRTSQGQLPDAQI